MAGVNAVTGHVLDGFEHVEQSIEKLIWTALGERNMREWVGNPGLKLLGENMTERTILLWFNTVWMLLELFEPRFRITKFSVNDATNLGVSDFTMHGTHKPFAHLEFQQAAAYVAIDERIVKIVPGA